MRYALPDQLHVRPMTAADHAVGDDGRQQRFNGAEQGDGERWTHERPDLLEARRWKARRGYRAGDRAETRADRLDRQIEELNDNCPDDECDEGTRNLPAHPRPED